MLYCHFILCLAGFLFSSTITGQSLSNPPPYQLSQDELTAFLGFNQSRASRTSLVHASVPFEDAKYERIIDTTQLCITHNTPSTEYKFESATCSERAKSPRSFVLQCMERQPTYPRTRPEPKSWFHYCSVGETCVDYQVVKVVDVHLGLYKDVYCQKAEKVKIDQLAGVAANPKIHGPNTHCSKPTEIPGSSFGPPTSNAAVDLILTEHTRWVNGSDYISPFLSIHDATTKYEFDRVTRRDSAIASAEVAVMPSRGKFPERSMEFCMRLAHRTDVWVVMTYTWFALAGDKIRNPEQPSDIPSDGVETFDVPPEAIGEVQPSIL